jgi:hypothetical protein
MIYHILPIEDIKPHIKTSMCECKPYIIEVDGGDILICHHSFDGREGVEMYRELTNT